ncbi:MAG: MBOAT family O-acyltransferase [Chthoniobacterales bacterium]
MIFTTLPFLIFLAATLPLYWALREDRWRLPLLFAANFIFYGWWDWRFTGLLLLVVTISYLGGRWLVALQDIRRRKIVLYLCCGSQLLVLGYFKYTDFFLTSVRQILETFGGSATWTTLNIILPVGISFYIFQAISYLVSVFRETVSCERSFLKLGVYLGFFPHLVAGPIIHASTFLPQLAEKRRFDTTIFLEGWRKFAIGFIYKSVFADNLAGPVDAIFESPATCSPIEILGGCLGFSAQIYFDFAGYSLMAIGVANLFGYFLPENFNYPYRATSVIDFWRRWHISLSTWLRDYVYIPLGGNRVSSIKLYRNLFITMFLGGLWHGASWNFVLWGGLHGLALCINHAWAETRIAKNFANFSGSAVVSWGLTQGLVLLCWIPFRSQSFTDTRIIFSKLTALFSGTWEVTQPLPWLLILLPLFADTWFVGSQKLKDRLTIQCNILAYCVLAIALLVGLLFMHVGFSPFIYFQF